MDSNSRDVELVNSSYDKLSQVMLTTVDNPYDPFTQFDEWFRFDTEHGYNSCGMLARIAHTSNDLTDYEYALEINNAIDSIIKNDPLLIYRRAIPKSE